MEHFIIHQPLLVVRGDATVELKFLSLNLNLKPGSKEQSTQFSEML